MVSTIKPDEKKLVLPVRWTPLQYHHEQNRLWRSKTRFRITKAGRRSGKTEIEGKRKLIIDALRFSSFPDGWFIAAAPTHAQAKAIFWNDLKLMVPKPFIKPSGISETDLTITLITGTRISVRSLDKPERLEGPPIDEIMIDEIANAKHDAWSAHIRPALDTPGRPGRASLFGVPEGRNHMHRMWNDALTDDSGEWDCFEWPSSDILTPEAMAAAMRDLDPLTFQQEYEAVFVAFQGRAYYQFDIQEHAQERAEYDPGLPLVFCFDFNISPGVAVVLQEQQYKGNRSKRALTVTACIDEVWIPKNSNTPMVCNKLLEKYSGHRGRVYCYGDPTGGAGGSAKVMGSDWDIINNILRPVFGSRLRFNVPSAPPRPRVRINALNSRLKSTDDMIHLMVDPKDCPHLIDDLDGVMILEGSAGELDKKSDKMLTHLSDALGYYAEYKFPVSSRRVSVVQV